LKRTLAVLANYYFLFFIYFFAIAAVPSKEGTIPTMSPQVTVLVPTYEPDPAHLRAALDSLFRQHCQDWNVVIHDDASTSDVEAIIAPYRASDRCTYIKSEKRLGIAGNWNACLKQAKNPFAQYLFQDDVWQDTYLERALKAMTSEVGLVVTAHKYQIEGTMRFDKELNAWYRHVEKERSELPTGRQNGKMFLLAWLKRCLHPNLIGEPSFVLVRRELFEGAGKFNSSFPQGLDLEMWTRLLPLTDLAFMKEDGGFFRVHTKGASARNKEEGAGLLDRLSVLDRLTKHVDTSIKSGARSAFSASLGEMFYKAEDRKAREAAVPLIEKLRFVQLALKHPLLTVKGIL
jgi:glycosyltransferase involved in cell wall biosynthesis